jgi:hypothetical protein
LGTWWEHIEKRQKPKNVQSLNVVFVMGQAKMPIYTKEKKWTLGGYLQLINMIEKKEIRGCSSSPPPMTSPRRKWGLERGTPLVQRQTEKLTLIHSKNLDMRQFRVRSSIESCQTESI